MNAARSAMIAVAVLVAVTLQISLFPHLALAGVVPDVVLVLVVAAALARGPQYGAQLGFLAGLVLDLAPPADHTVGRWALTFVVVGYLTGLVRSDAERSLVTSCVVVAAGSFIGTSIFALSGLALGDAGVTVARALSVIGIAVVYDAALAVVAVPLVRASLRCFEATPVRW